MFFFTLIFILNLKVIFNVFCRNDLDAKSFSLVIKNANISVLDMTYGFFSKIGLENDLVSRLEKLRIVNTTLQHINICSLEKNEDQDLIKCESLSGLRSLDLRDNQLTGLREFRLESLVDLNLAGQYISRNGNKVWYTKNRTQDGNWY